MFMGYLVGPKDENLGEHLVPVCRLSEKNAESVTLPKSDEKNYDFIV